MKSARGSDSPRAAWAKRPEPLPVCTMAMPSSMLAEMMFRVAGVKAAHGVVVAVDEDAVVGVGQRLLAGDVDADAVALDEVAGGNRVARSTPR